MKISKDRIALYLFLGSLAMVLFGYGIVVGRFQIFPYHWLSLASDEFEQLRAQGRFGDEVPFGYAHARNPDKPAVYNSGEACPGLNFMVRIKEGQQLTAEIMTLDGETLHEWVVDWFDIWPDADHLPERAVPKSHPGTHIHGAVVTKEGRLIFNFDHLGLVCLDRDGKVLWRLPYQTHHSVTLDDDGNLWVSAQKEHTEWDERFPNRIPPYQEYMILVVNQQGEILREWSVADLLKKNGLEGLLYLGSISMASTQVQGDVLHMNDVEPFPKTMKEGFFKKGDVLISLRNINSVVVFDSKTDKVKFVTFGKVVRQHDPDFLDGNTISIFDNHSTAEERRHPQSRIVNISAPDDRLEVVYQGTKEHPFFTNVMGKHQILPNGDILIAESGQGRAFEVTPEGKIVWEYINYVDDKTVGFLEQVDRLPADYFTKPWRSTDQQTP